MIKKTLSIFVLTTLSLPTLADTIGEFKCNVKSVHITEMIEGKATNYSSMKGEDAVNVNDSLTVNYDLSGDILLIKFGKKGSTKLFGDYIKGRTFGKYVEYTALTPSFEFFMTDEVFHSSYDMETIELERYYKSDWDGFYVKIDHNTVKTYGLDCRTVKDGYADLMKLTEGK